MGIGQTVAASLIAEIGMGMTRFVSDKHIASWARDYAGNKQSGGKRLSGITTKGNPYLRAILYARGLGHRPHQRQLFVGDLTPHGSATWQTESHHGSGP